MLREQKRLNVNSPRLLVESCLGGRVGVNYLVLWHAARVRMWTGQLASVVSESLSQWDRDPSRGTLAAEH